MTRDIMQRSRALMEIASQWDRITPDRQERYIAQLRTSLNDLTQATTAELGRYNQGLFRQDHTPQIAGNARRYVDMYESLRRQYADRIPFEVAPLRADDRQFIFRQMQDFRNAMSERTELFIGLTEDKIELQDTLRRQYDRLIGQDEEFIRRTIETAPVRVTLLDAGSRNSRIAQERIQGAVADGISRGDDFRRIWRKASSQVKSIYPDANFVYRDGDGNPRQMNTNHYINMWVRDMETLGQGKAVEAYMDAAGLDLVVVEGGVTDNHICDPFSTPPNNIYSLSGRDTRYPRLEKEPPYHPNCTKYLMMYFGD